MNHHRFGWQDDGRSDTGRDEMDRGRYRGESDRYRGSGERSYSQGSDRTSSRYGSGMDENYGDMDFRREQERDEIGRFQGRSNYQGGYTPSSGGRGYGEMDFNNGRERDDMGRFTGRSGYESQYGRMGDWGNYEGRTMGGYGGSGSYGNYGGMGSSGGGGRMSGYSSEKSRESGNSRGYSGMGGYGGMMGGDSESQNRDSMGRFTSQQSQRSGQRTQGPHTGRGPKNYQRSEERIREEVSERLEDDGFLDASEIEIKVKDGIVTLTGSVESREDKRRAEQLAEDCPGVKDVLNQLRMSKSGRESGQQQGSSKDSGQSEKSVQDNQGSRKSA